MDQLTYGDSLTEGEVTVELYARAETYQPSSAIS